MKLPGKTEGAAQQANWDSKWADITTGLIVAKMEMAITEDGAGNYNLVRLSNSGILMDTMFRTIDASNGIRFYCGTGDFTATYTYSLDTFFIAEWYYYVDNGTTDKCTGITPGCEECGCLWINGTEIGNCDSDDGDNLDPDGIYFGTGTALDQGVANWAVCDEIPPAGTYCGDS
jgi:hypothetical protein